MNSDTAFTGSIPQYYDQYLGPLIFEEYGKDLAHRISVPHGAIVLETAAGTGIATRHLRNNLPRDVQIIATDLNKSMLRYAKRKLESYENITFKVEDATHLSFPNASFDAVMCQFSVMFFADKLAAMKEVRRVLKPKGVFVFNLWDSFIHNHLIQTVNNALMSLFSKNPLHFFDTPYGCHRIDEIRTVLTEAGFGEIEISILPKICRFETAKQAALGYIMGTPICLHIAERGECAIEEVITTVERALCDTFERSANQTKMQAIVFKAHLCL